MPGIPLSWSSQVAILPGAGNGQGNPWIVDVEEHPVSITGKRSACPFTFKRGIAEVVPAKSSPETGIDPAKPEKFTLAGQASDALSVLVKIKTILTNHQAAPRADHEVIRSGKIIITR